MRLIVQSSGFYPYTMKPVDYQPYRPVYLFRGPPPDAGFSYGLFEDEEMGKKYYADLGLESFSPLSGKSAKLLEELSCDEIKKLLSEDLKKENLRGCDCSNCGSTFYDNFHLGLKGREGFFCHRCGCQLPEGEKEMNPHRVSSAINPSNPVTKDPRVLDFVTKGLSSLMNSSQMHELAERLSLKYNVDKERAKHDILTVLKQSIPS